MGDTSLALLLISLPLLLFPALSCSQSPLAPAVYIFGDSVVDVGNNNFLRSEAKVNFPPYGIDFPGGAATGRFSNGRTAADFLPEWIGIHVPPPIMDRQATREANTEGFNYASGGTGILPETGLISKSNLSMKSQVDLFKKTVQEYLPSLEKYSSKPTELSDDLAKSIFLIHMGSNDYAENYFNIVTTTSTQYSPEQFAELLVTELAKSIQDLYNLGARRLVVFNVSPLGCLPIILDMVKPATRCFEPINAAVLIFNTKLGEKLDQLSATLAGATLVKGDINKLTQDIINNPSQYGFTETLRACCTGENGSGPCKPQQNPCPDRKSFQFWDNAHPTEAMHELFSSKCFNGTGMCTPMNILELLQKA